MTNKCRRAAAPVLGFFLVLCSLTCRAESIDDIACSGLAQLRVSVKLGNPPVEIPADPRIARATHSPFQLGVAYGATFNIYDGGKVSVKPVTDRPHCEYEIGGYDGEAFTMPADLDPGKITFSCDPSDPSRSFDRTLTCSGTPGKRLTIGDLKAILGPRARLSVSDDDLTKYRAELARNEARLRDSERIKAVAASLAAGDPALRAQLKASCQAVAAGVLSDARFAPKAAEVTRLEDYARPLMGLEFTSVRGRLGAPNLERLHALFAKLPADDPYSGPGVHETWLAIEEITEPVTEAASQYLSAKHGSADGLTDAPNQEQDSRRPWDIRLSVLDDKHSRIPPSITICRDFETRELGRSTLCETEPLFADAPPSTGGATLQTDSVVSDDPVALPLNRMTFARQVFDKALLYDTDSAEAAQLCPLVLAAGDYAPAPGAVEADGEGARVLPDGDTAPAQVPVRHWTVLSAQ